MEKSTMKKGAILTLLGATCWGLSGVLGEYLLNISKIDSTWVIANRLFYAGIVLVIILFLKDKKINNKKDKSISEKKNRIDITREVYNFAKKIGIISEFEEQKCYLSEVDFENDLAKVVLTNTEEQNKMITFLQRSKWAHLFKEKYYKQIFSEESIEKIVESEYFKCIKDLINDERE